MLFYYTRDLLEDAELVSRLQEKVHLAKETVGWEFVIAGLLDHNTYTRMVTVGLPLAVLPRRESTCAHTVNQPAGTIFTLLNMTKDWRFEKSPHVEQGGLRAYAGAPLRFETEFGEHVAFGSLCVASNSEQEHLSQSQQRSLARLADWVVSDIVHSKRATRQRERRRMQELLDRVQKQCDERDEHEGFEEVVLETLRQLYPASTVALQRSHSHHVSFGGQFEIPIDDFEHGLWEDVEYFDYLIENLNHQELVAPRVVRVIGAECEHAPVPAFLAVGSMDFRLVFDDIDAWFVQRLAALLGRMWHSHALREAQATKETFLRGITHQLRTPIHGILGSVELLFEELKSRYLIDVLPSLPNGTPDAEQANPHMYIKTIRSSARELISTVNSMIKLNRWTEIAEAERVIALHHIEEIEIALLNEVVQVMPDDLAARPSIIFNHRLPSKCDSLLIDLRLLVDCLQPLVVNAVQNTTGGVVALTTTVSDDYQTLTFDVYDTGCGIDANDQQRILLPYEKVDAHTTGAGLGLTLACRVATLVNGSVSLISSDIGKGSHFRAAFQNPICACSFPPLQSSKETSTHPPSAFRRLPSSPSTLSLSHCFSNYLIGQGYTESTNATSSVVVLDFTPDLAELRRRTTEISKEEFGVCLVPESSYLLDFQDRNHRRDGNTMYVRGPFITKTLNQALAQAHTILAEMSLSLANPQPLGSDGHIAESSLSDPTADDTHVLAPTPLPSAPASITEEFTVSIKNLNINGTSLTPIVRTTMRSTKPMTLLVDDNVVNLRLLQMYCKRRGIPYRTAADGQQAVDLVKRHQSLSSPMEDTSSDPAACVQPFELVLMDLQMPVCDGVAATRQIRLLESANGWSKSAIFMVTGQDSSSDRVNAEQAGADEYLVKPAGPKTLDHRIRQWFPDSE